MTDATERANPKPAKVIGLTVCTDEDVADRGYDACLRGELIRVPGAA